LEVHPLSKNCELNLTQALQHHNSFQVIRGFKNVCALSRESVTFLFSHKELSTWRVPFGPIASQADGKGFLDLNTPQLKVRSCCYLAKQIKLNLF
jgi:hypothetical protein